MSNLIDPNEKYNTVKERVITMLIQYDEHVRDSHANLIQMAEHMTKGTPMEIPERKYDEPLKYYRYMSSPIFRLTVDTITEYITSNTKE